MPKLPDDWHPRDERDGRIEELEAEVERWMDLCDKASENETRSRKRAERAEAEVERLRAKCAAVQKVIEELRELNPPLAETLLRRLGLEEPKPTEPFDGRDGEYMEEEKCDD